MKSGKKGPGKKSSQLSSVHEKGIDYSTGAVSLNIVSLYRTANHKVVLYMPIWTYDEIDIARKKLKLDKQIVTVSN